jgi:HSP20 family protein
MLRFLTPAEPHPFHQRLDPACVSIHSLSGFSSLRLAFAKRTVRERKGYTMAVSDEHNRRIQVYRRRDTVERRGWYFRHQEVHALFDELIHRPWGAVKWNPAVDVRESKDAFIIEMDLPGVKTEEVRIVKDDRILVIEGRRQLAKCDEATTHLCERPDGRFTRTFEFDENIENREIKSHWQDGVLTLTMPKSRSE